MRKSQANRAVVARRIPAQAPEVRISVRETSEVTRAIRTRDIREASKRDPRNRKAVRMTAAQRDSEGHKSAWNDSPYLQYGLAAIANDKRWNETASK